MERAESDVSSSNRLPVLPPALLRAAGVAALLLGTMPALAQEAGGPISTTIPTLRGSVAGSDQPDVDPSAAPAEGAAATTPPGSAAGGGSAAGAPPSSVTTDGSAPDGATPDGAAKTARNRFVFPKGSAKTVDRTRIPRKGPPVLPPLQPYPTSARLRGSGAAVDTIGTIDTISPPTGPAPSVAVLPYTARLRTRIEDKPYDAVGIDVGSLRLTPFVTQSFGFDSNPDQAQTGLKPSAYSRTDGGLGVLSTWSSNELKADLHGGYNDYFSDPQANRPDAAGTIDYRYDVDHRTTLDSEARFAIESQRIGSPEVSNTAVDRPLISTFGGAVGGAETLGRLTLALHGSIDRTAYDNTKDSNGVLDDLASENFDDYGVHLRATYEVTPVLSPFVDVLVDRRIHDREVDLSGFRRDSDGVIGQVGSSFELNRLFTGEVSLGYGDRTYQDKTLKDVTGPVFNGSLAYAVTPLTTISFRAATSFDETTVAGASGAESHSATLEISHALLRNLTITGALSYLNTDYIGVPITENTLSETLKAEYHLSRSLVATATFNHEKLDSTSAGSSYAQDVFLLGLRWQR